MSRWSRSRPLVSAGPSLGLLLPCVMEILQPVLRCCPGERQGSLSQMLQLVRAGPILPLSHLPPVARGEAGGHLSLSLSHVATWHPKGCGVSSSNLTPLGGFICTPANKVSSTVKSRRGAVPALPCAAAGEGQGQLSCLLDPGGNLPTYIRWQVEMGASLPPHTR